MKFTFYGDLLGVSSAYKLGAKTAYDKLNAFYEETFRTLTSVENQVEMFSDSVLVIGDNACDALPDIARVFANLIRKGLLLRGAMVKGKLTYEARQTRQNFQKRLPNDDKLARALGLEKSQKGSRFLIEPALAKELLRHNPDWLSQKDISDQSMRTGTTNSVEFAQLLTTTRSSIFTTGQTELNLTSTQEE